MLYLVPLGSSTYWLQELISPSLKLNSTNARSMIAPAIESITHGAEYGLAAAEIACHA